MKKRKWVYINKPDCYEIRCDKCKGSNIEWSEYEHKIWCYDCGIDTNGTAGIFDGPVGIGACEILGCSLNRYYFKSKNICRIVIDKNNKVVYRKIKKGE